ncbi:NAD(+) diphosphatase [Mangrovitalea sediminis]|uniref:NAD(+) diphosphatase n=1 Tax=Mangrovitalea sediminis TaxID=1982043 RepID=UPI000BE5548E|nr:NAD(+) diphosphatase [Mangrovitalea sediminis]
MTDLVPAWSLEPPTPDETLLVFAGQRLLLKDQRPLWSVSDWASSLSDPCRSINLFPIGERGGRRVHVLGLDAAAAPEGVEAIDLRRFLAQASAEDWELVGTASELLHWWQDHRFCGRCGTPTKPHPVERALWCEPCQHRWFPRVSPCVIVVIRRDDQLLLARAPHYPEGMFSLIAGFIEPGESAEEAVAREVLEETGLQVANPRYVASQPWPFPHQLMLGYMVDYVAGELVLQEDELADGGWFSADSLPRIPGVETIAGQLIRAALASQDGVDKVL